MLFRSGTVRVSCWKLQTQKLLKLSDEEIQKFRSNDGFEKYKTELLGEQIKILGAVKNNMLGKLELSAELLFRDLNPEQEIEMLKHEKPVVNQASNYVPQSNFISNNNSNTQSQKTSYNQSNSSEKTTSNKTITSNDTDDEFEISEDFLE